MKSIKIVNTDDLAKHPLVMKLGSSPSDLMEAIFNHVQTCNIEIKSFICDHLCWRCSTLEEYMKIKQLFSTKENEDGLGHILVECMIGGRPISTIHLNQPVIIKTNSDYEFEIPTFELPCPKPGRAYESGWEHCEFAVHNQYQKLEHFVEDYKQKINFDYRAYSKRSNNDVSLEVYYTKENRTKTGQVKFHLLPLEEVVKRELAEGKVELVSENYFVHN